MGSLFRNIRRRRQSPRRRFRNRGCAAALRSVTAARFYLGGTIPTLELAAASCGSNVPYVRAAIVVLQSEGHTLERVLAGKVPLLAAAQEVRRLADLLAAYRRATPQDLVALGRAVTAERLWADAIVPAIGAAPSAVMAGSAS